MSSDVVGDKNVSIGIYISHLHFDGRVNFVNSSPFSTSLGLNVGAVFIVPDDSNVTLSGNITSGMRYELSEQWALKADLRVYGTILQIR